MDLDDFTKVHEDLEGGEEGEAEPEQMMEEGDMEATAEEPAKDDDFKATDEGAESESEEKGFCSSCGTTSSVKKIVDEWHQGSGQTMYGKKTVMVGLTFAALAYICLHFGSDKVAAANKYT